MKTKLTLILILLLNLTSYAQEKLTYTDVIEVDATKDELYERAKLWFVNQFKDSKEVIQAESKEDGYIIGKAATAYTPVFMASQAVHGMINYTVKINVKDGKYKYEVTDFIHEPYAKLPDNPIGMITTAEQNPHPRKGAGKWSQKAWKAAQEIADREVVLLVNSLKNAMEKQSTLVGEEW